MALILGTLLFLLHDSAIPTGAQSLDDVLDAVSGNVKDFQTLLPDFICNERIISTAYESGTVRTVRTVNSVLTAVQKPSPGPSGVRLGFTERREIRAIDGNTVRRDTKMPKLPWILFGGFGSLLSATFSPPNLEFHIYKLEKDSDNGRLVIHFATREGQHKLHTFLVGESQIERDTGTAWIDASSMQVVRLQRDFLALPRNLSKLRNTVDYSPVTIGDRDFWLPRTIRSDAAERNPKRTKTFLAEYTDCRKFEADVKIVP